MWNVIREAFLGTFDLFSGLAESAGWMNLAESFKKLKEAVEPVLNKIGEVLTWLWDNVLEVTNSLVRQVIDAINESAGQPIITDGKSVTDGVVSRLRSEQRSTGKAGLLI